MLFIAYDTMMNRIFVALALIALLIASLTGCGPSAPESLFDANPLDGFAPEEVQFTDMSRGNVTDWAWDFDNDGIIDSIHQNPKHLYAHPGNYTVSLTVTGSGGNDTELKVDYLKFIPCPQFADFSAETTRMQGVHPIQFTDLTDITGLQVGNITSWAWDFNSDGTIESTEQNPRHTYTRNGLYSVTLTVTTPECEDTLTRYEYITVTGCSR
jgi:PKD repeat protein